MKLGFDVLFVFCILISYSHSIPLANLRVIAETRGSQN